MSIDKFGHYLNDTKSNISIKNAPKLLGFFVDTSNNIDLQNKRIRNVAQALEENDAINKLFLQTQIEKLQQEITLLLEDINKKNNENITHISSVLTKQIEEIREKVYRLESYLFVTIGKTVPKATHPFAP